MSKMEKFFYIGLRFLSVLILGLLLGCTSEESQRLSSEKNKRLIVIAMDFSESTVSTKIREREINFINKLKSCFRSGDRIHLYQITNRSFKNPKIITNVCIPYPGRLETESQILRKYRLLYKKNLKDKYQGIMDLSYEGTDISGFLLFVEREFNIQDHDKILIIISDGIESTDHINPELLIANGSEDAIDYIKGKGYIANLENWKVIRTGLWRDISPPLMKLYDDFWEIYFREAHSNYSRVGFEISEPPSALCELF